MVTKTLTGVGENHWLKSIADHISMHSKGVESFGKTSHYETRGIMAAIKDLQRSHVAMWVEFQSLRQETAVPQGPQGP